MKNVKKFQSEVSFFPFKLLFHVPNSHRSKTKWTRHSSKKIVESPSATITRKNFDEKGGTSHLR